MKKRINRIEKTLEAMGPNVNSVKAERDKFELERAATEFFMAFGNMTPSDFYGMLEKDNMNRSDIGPRELAEYLWAKARAKTEGISSEPKR